MWLLLTATSPSEASNAEIAAGLVDLGGTAVEENGLLLRTFLPAPDAPDTPAGDSRTSRDEIAGRLADQAAQLLSARIGGEPVNVQWTWQKDEDWSARWKAGLGPRRISDRLIVTPSWTLADVVSEPDDVVIVIDPQMAFGTAEHASTRGVLRLLDSALLARTDLAACRVLDVGTGSGILAIAADRLGAGSVDAVEVDPDAIEVARINARINHAERVHVEHASVDVAFLEARADRYDVIAANVLHTVLEPLLPAFRRALRPGGALIVGGILQDEAADMSAAAAASRFEVTCEDREDDWWSALLAPGQPSAPPSG